jgi:hypothetical protein
MDREVMNAYVWNDIDLNYNFYETLDGLRYTISLTNRSECVSKLLLLNGKLSEKAMKGNKEKAKTNGKSKRAEADSEAELF